jgi:hypothetical protein
MREARSDKSVHGRTEDLPPARCFRSSGGCELTPAALAAEGYAGRPAQGGAPRQRSAFARRSAFRRGFRGAIRLRSHVPRLEPSVEMPTFGSWA